MTSPEQVFLDLLLRETNRFQKIVIKQLIYYNHRRNNRYLYPNVRVQTSFSVTHIPSSKILLNVVKN